ncbi:hypothetical protein CAEBREN_10435 [Caenorhabditis brenneri]|uniref:Homeobox domain-containing protein n=1 Tax=Caenorhabditis brenneri TaxID=135651 RepID=G0P068_CAEBE|nr:hypothetical protein CAEBREN_10435 [Caenorhabditis brenneri]
MIELIRVTITGYPLQVLETRFHLSRFIDSAECEVLGVKLGIKPRKIKEWFGNKRSREGNLTSENLQDPEILKLLDEVRRETRNKKFVLSIKQREELEELYASGRQLGEEERIAIGNKMKVPEYCIKNWWTNRSRKNKDEGKKESSGTDGLMLESDRTLVPRMPSPCNDGHESYPILRKLITDEPNFQLNDSTDFPYHLDEQAHVPSKQSKFGENADTYEATEAHQTHLSASDLNFPQDFRNYPNAQTSTLKKNPASSRETHLPSDDFSFPQDFPRNHNEPTIEENPPCFAETEEYSTHLHSSGSSFHQDFNNYTNEHTSSFETNPATFKETHLPATDSRIHPNEPSSTFRKNSHCCFSQYFNNRPVEQSITIFEDYVPNPQEFGRLPATFEEAHPLAFHSNFSQTCTGYPHETTSFETVEACSTQLPPPNSNYSHGFNTYLDEQRNPAFSEATEACSFQQHTSRPDCNFSRDCIGYPNETTSFDTTESYPTHSPSDLTMNLQSTSQVPNDDDFKNYHNDSYCNSTFPTVFDFPNHSTSETNSQFI